MKLSFLPGPLQATPFQVLAREMIPVAGGGTWSQLRPAGRGNWFS